VPKNITGYRWDEEKDALLDVEGNPIEENPALLTYTPIGHIHTWDKASCPRDLTNRDDHEIYRKIL
jgi:hypothetical protein